jgi:superfamily II DNA/RNA helicase
VELFRRPLDDGGANYLVATDAAGEGINLQFCWLMVNYDVPWSLPVWMTPTANAAKAANNREYEHITQEFMKRFP